MKVTVVFGKSMHLSVGAKPRPQITLTVVPSVIEDRSLDAYCSSEHLFTLMKWLRPRV